MLKLLTGVLPPSNLSERVPAVEEVRYHLRYSGGGPYQGGDQQIHPFNVSHGSI